MPNMSPNFKVTKTGTICKAEFANPADSPIPPFFMKPVIIVLGVLAVLTDLTYGSGSPSVSPSGDIVVATSLPQVKT